MSRLLVFSWAVSSTLLIPGIRNSCSNQPDGGDNWVWEGHTGCGETDGGARGGGVQAYVDC